MTALTDGIPQPGDLVIRMRRHSAAVFVLGRDREPPQITCNSYQEALERALPTAERARIDVWYSMDGVTFERVATFRPTRE